MTMITKYFMTTKPITGTYGQLTDMRALEPYTVPANTNFTIDNQNIDCITIMFYKNYEATYVTLDREELQTAATPI